MVYLAALVIASRGWAGSLANHVRKLAGVPEIAATPAGAQPTITKSPNTLLTKLGNLNTKGK